MSLSPAQYVQRLRQIVTDFDDLQSQIDQRVNEAAVAEAKWKTARAKTLLTSTGKSADIREAEAIATHEQLFADYKITNALADAAIEKGRALRAQLSGVQSAAALTRTEMEHFGAIEDARESYTSHREEAA